MHAMHGCDTVHEFVLSHEFVLYWRIHYPYSIYIFIRTWIRQNSMPETDEETMTTNDHSGIPDTLVVSSKNCLADLLIGSYVWISWWVNYKQTILAVVYFRSAGTLPCGHWSVAKEVYETGEAADNIKVFFPQTVYTSYNYCCTCVVGG